MVLLGNLTRMDGAKLKSRQCQAGLCFEPAEEEKGKRQMKNSN
jgi:hypothetical protein